MVWSGDSNKAPRSTRLCPGGTGAPGRRIVVGRARAAFRRFCPPALLLGLLLALANRADAQAPQALPEIQIISTSPFSGGGTDRDKVPALAQTITAEDISRTYSQNIIDTLFQRIPGMSTSDQ